MALIGSLGALAGAGVFLVLAAACGNRILRACKVTWENDLEKLLFQAAAGVIAFEGVLALALWSGRVRAAVYCALLLLAMAGVFLLGETLALLRRLLHGSRASRGIDKLLLLAIGLVLLFAGLAAVAPLTGSDALHYHFTAASLLLRAGFRPEFSLAHSFWTGQGHLLILTGLALGGEKLALALLLAGGALAAAVAGCLARKWMPRTWAIATALAFLLTPVVFWQMTAAGAPDLWMAFFVPLGVLSVARANEDAAVGHVIIAGLLAGAIAGTKYTGCIFAGSLALVLLIGVRSPKRLAVFFASALAAGIWPYIRNFAWTGDPVFPFAMRWLAPQQIHAQTVASLLSDTRAGVPKVWWHALDFPLFGSFHEPSPGFWHFFGPLCLAFAPLVAVARRKTPLWRCALVVWILGGVAVGVTSDMTRFLLPVFPVALAAAFAGAAHLRESKWKAAGALACASIAVFSIFGAGGMLLYNRGAVSAAAGLIPRDAYLRQRGPDYAKAEFVNRTIGPVFTDGTVLVFFRHLYYLRVPFMSGDPENSWAVDSKRLQTGAAWREFFREHRVRWVARAPGYPEAIAAPLRELEASGVLVPFARDQVEDIAGMRIQGQRIRVEIVVLRVVD